MVINDIRRFFIFLALMFFSIFSAVPAFGDSGDSKSGVSPNSLSLPAGPGSLGGIGENVTANLNMGLMSYPISVKLPKGRNNFTPSIGIVYSSAAGSGVMGIGWTLSTGGSVERLTVRGLPRYISDDHFYAGTGEIVKIPNSPFYRSRIEGAFVRYRWFHTGDQRGYWVAEYPDGSKSYFGADSQGNIDLNSQVYGAKGTFRWELRTRIDRNGNRIEYHYFREKSQVYLESIEWVFNEAGKALYKVEIRYEDRPDVISDCKPGFDLTTEKRVKELTVFSEGQRIRSYRFDFDESSGLSRLIKVTRFGKDPQKPYPVRFTIKYSDATFSPTTSRMVSMPTSVSQDFRARNADFIDINGDGLPDVVDTSQDKHQFHINVLTLDDKLQQKTHDFPRSRIVENPKRLSARLKNPSVQMLDYNGDGFTDMVDAVNRQIYINKGNSRWEDKSEALGSFPVTGKDPNMRFFDYNGDKAIDVISSNGDTTTYWVSDKKGSWKRVDGGKGIGASFSKDKVRLIDMNGDGLSDAVQIYEGTMRYKKYYGYGKWSSWITVSVPGLTKSHADKAQFADINGDGLSDMVVFLGTSIMYFVNKNGLTFRKGQALKKFKGIDIPDSTQNSIRIADINGNGSRDIVWISPSGKITYLELFSRRPNLLISISNGIGQRIEVTYGSSVYHRLRDEALGHPWKNKLPMAFTVVNQIRTWAETDGSQKVRPHIQNIYYHNGYYDGKEKKFRGFRNVENVIEGDDSVDKRLDKVFFDVGDKDSYFHGKMLRRVITDSKGKIFNETTLTWDDCGQPAGTVKGLNPPIRFICLKAEEQLIKEGLSDKSRWKITRTEHTYDGYGNVILNSLLGEKDKKGDEIYTRIEFITPKDPLSPTSLWNLRNPKTVEICEDLHKECAQIRYYYDGEAFKGLPLGQMTKGNLMRSEMKVELGKDKWLTPQSFKLNKYGSRVETKDLNGSIRKIEWDDVYKRFAVKETVIYDKKKLVASVKWDYKLNAIIQNIDFNGHITLYGYDNFGRLQSIVEPGDSPSTPSIRYEYDLKGPLNRIIIHSRTKKGGPFDLESIKCFDGLGRLISEQHRIDDKNFLVFNHIAYNTLGQKAILWKRYTSDGTCSFLPPKNVKKTKYFYDSIGRFKRIEYPDGSFSRYVYEPFKNIYYDEEDTRKDSPYYNTPKIEITDGLGRIIESIEMPKKGDKITTKYAYTALNVKGRSLVTTVTFDDGSQKKQFYDLLGQMRKIVDPDRATITVRYNDRGEIIEKTDARGIVTLFTYDGLSRLKTRMQKGHPETKVEYFFDTPQKEFATAKNLKGRLSRIDYPGGSYLFSYNEYGQVVRKKHIFMGVALETSRRYNHIHKMISKTFLDGRTLTYKWDLLGRLIEIPTKFKEISFFPNGLMKSWTGPNDVKTEYLFDVRNRVKEISVDSGKVMKLTYRYDHVGNILSQKEQHGGQPFENLYNYDALYRLTQANLLGGKEILTYGQDHLHNITKKISSLGNKSPSNIGNYTYDKKKIHAVTKAGNISLKYDKSGNMIQRGKLAYRWDYLNRLVETKVDGKIRGRYWYNHSYRRIIKEEDGLHTFYPEEDVTIRGGDVIITLHLGLARAISWRSSAFLAKFYDDLAPATGNKTLKPKPDGKITVADAWLYHAARKKILDLPLKKRPFDIDLTDDMLQASVEQLFFEKTERTYTLHSDHLNSIRAVTDEKGNVISRKHFYPYGAIRQRTGTIVTHGFMGSERDELTKTNYFGLRSLDPALARWLIPDPNFETIGGTNDEFNSYGTLKNNPLRYFDPNGTTSEDSGSNLGFAAGEMVFGLAMAAYDIYGAVSSAKHGDAGNFSTQAKTILSSFGAVLGIATFAFQASDNLQGAYAIMTVQSFFSFASSAFAFHAVLKKHQDMQHSHRKTAIGAMTIQVASSVVSMGGSIAALADPDGPGSDIASYASYVGLAAGIVGEMILTDLPYGKQKRGQAKNGQGFLQRSLSSVKKGAGHAWSAMKKAGSSMYGALKTGFSALKSVGSFIGSAFSHFKKKKKKNRQGKTGRSKKKK